MITFTNCLEKVPLQQKNTIIVIINYGLYTPEVMHLLIKNV